MNKILLYILLLVLPAAAFAATAEAVRTEKAVLPAADTVAQQERSLQPDFKSRYKGDEFVYEHKTKAKSMFERFLEWLGNLWDSIFGKSGGKQADLTWKDILIRVLAIIVILFVVYMIVQAILNKEGGWIFGRGRKKINSYEVSEEDISRMDFPNLIRATTEAGNYRLAVRYYYLWLLRNLSDREIIAWHSDKTNTDYLYEIKSESLRKEFEYLSYVYDYSWYGEFELTPDAYAKAERAFTRTINTL